MSSLADPAAPGQQPGQAAAGHNEASPLLDGHRGATGPDLERAHPDSDYWQRSKSVWYLVLLTISIGGLQIAWCVELSNGSPYLLSLGLSKSLMALVWIAGPLSGTLVQPYVGMRSDRCRLRWGKRRPFMVGGALATMVSLLCLAWTKEAVGGVLGWLGLERETGVVKNSIIVVAVIWVYILDFAINAVQAAIRAFIVDCAPAHQQEAANSMASRITGVGNIFGYVAGYANLPRILGPVFGPTQFQDLCAIASIALGVTVALSCIMIPERDPRLEDAPAPAADNQVSSSSSSSSASASATPPAQSNGIVAFFKHIFASMRRLPPQVKKVCLVEFCAWVGFFPLLFYTSEFVGEIYVEPFLQANPHMTPAELDALYEQATRVGTFALLIYAITSLCVNLFLPFFIDPTYDNTPLARLDGAAEAAQDQGRDQDQEVPAKPWLDHLVIPGFTLRRAWMFSLMLFSVCMFCTVLVTSVAAATALIGLVGFTWALTLWAPWAIIGAEVSRRDAVLRQQKRRKQERRRKQKGPAGQADGEDEGPEEQHDQAGVILGIHNMSIAAPQIISTIGSSIVFKFLQKPRGTPGDRSIPVVMALGGITVLGAVYLVHRMDDEPAEALAGDEPRDAPAGGNDNGRRGENGDNSAAVDGEEDVADVADAPPTGVKRRLSSEQLSRASLDKAAAARGSSYGGGLEY